MIKPADYKCLNKTENTLEIKIKVNPDLFYFNGHFNGQPLLPGFVQVGWACDFTEEMLGYKVIGSVPKLKFTAPVLPEDEILLKINVNEQKHFFDFEYIILNNNNASASQGRVKIHE